MNITLLVLALAVCLSSIRYCGALDGVLAGHVTDISSTEQKHLFHQFLSLSMSSGKFQVLDTVSSRKLFHQSIEIQMYVLMEDKDYEFIIWCLYLLLSVRLCFCRL